MNNDVFDIKFNLKNGTVKSITNKNDTAGMNWCLTDGEWGKPDYTYWQGAFEPIEIQLESFSQNSDKAISVYSAPSLRITVERFFDDNGNFTERYIIKNLQDCDLFLKHGDLGIELPFNDEYPYADICMTNYCNTHIWCGHHTAFISALKMGESDINLGLVLTKGAIDSYSQNETKGNHRGRFVLNTEQIELLAKEEYILEWKLFWFNSKDDFNKKAFISQQFINIKAAQNTVFKNEIIEFEITVSPQMSDIEVFCDSKPVAFTKKENLYYIHYIPNRLGEHKFIIKAENISTYAEFFVCENFETLIEKRLNFIVDKQQYTRSESQLCGAFLIYDNKEDSHVFDIQLRDWNACRERVGMPLFLTKYLQTHKNEKFEKALLRYVEFAEREFYDTQTGEVFDGVGKDKRFLRLYNAPWITTLYTELYLLFGKTEYLQYVLKTLRYYYSNGGERFYPNGLSMRKTVEAFEKSGLKAETEEVLKLFKNHVDTMVEIGISYPKHEANYEQTIVTPAVTYISEMGYLTKEEIFAKRVKQHIKILERFNGHQPSFHLNEIPIRYWDDFWFGKSRMYGDVFPHYWSCLTARAYKAYYDISGDGNYLKSAQKCIRNCLCLFEENGKGHCAYVYPFMLNDKKGRFYDEWANDQDFALYFALELNIF